ncbi:NAD-dependent epimerase/dehydratase family protein [Thermodesulfobacteriota bacterium]
MDKDIKKVLVIGASGFIGGRLVEKLILDHQHIPKCLYRNYGKLSRIARFNVDLVHGDILFPENYEKDIADCDIFVFCVHGKGKDIELNWKINTIGLENMLKIAVKNKIKQFIFLSTTAIYEEGQNQGEFNEKNIPNIIKKDYAGGKIKGEELCKKYSKRYGLKITILRPTIVYGPFAPSFTIYPAELIKSGALKDYGFFTGLCNPIYVDDVVNSIVFTFLNKDAINETFIISSGETIEWLKFYNYFSVAISGKKLSQENFMAYKLKATPLRLLKTILKSLVGFAPDLAKSVYGFIKSKGSGDWTWVKGVDVSTLKPNFYKKRLVFRTDKMKNRLMYIPEYTFEKGFEITKEWLKHQGY